jgi:hypothetical protein
MQDILLAHILVRKTRKHPFSLALGSDVYESAE